MATETKVRRRKEQLVDQVPKRIRALQFGIQYVFADSAKRRLQVLTG